MRKGRRVFIREREFEILARKRMRLACSGRGGIYVKRIIHVLSLLTRDVPVVKIAKLGGF